MCTTVSVYVHTYLHGCVYVRFTVAYILLDNIKASVLKGEIGRLVCQWNRFLETAGQNSVWWSLEKGEGKRNK